MAARGDFRFRLSRLCELGGRQSFVNSHFNRRLNDSPNDGSGQGCNPIRRLL